MIRKNFYLAEKDINKLEKEAEKLGISTSELLRRILYEYFKEKDGK